MRKTGVFCSSFDLIFLLIYFRCYYKKDKSCPATAVAKENPNIIRVQGYPHSHDPIVDEVKELKKLLYNEARKVSSETNKQIFERVAG